MFIGNKKIQATFEDKNNKVKLEFNDNSSTLINKDLLALIQTEEESKGSVTDNINDYFARKFVAELAFYGLGFYFSNSVGIAMSTLSHNLREELFRETFKCTGADDINLRLLLKLDK